MSSFEFHSKEPADDHVGLVVNGKLYYWTCKCTDEISLSTMASNLKFARPKSHVWYTAGKTKVFMTLPA